MSCFNTIILELKESHHSRPWNQRLFFPAKLASKLENYSENSPTSSQDILAILNAIENNSWIFHKKFSTSLQKFYTSDHRTALRTLNILNHLIGENFGAAVTHKEPYAVAKALDILHKAALLTDKVGQDNFNLVVTHQTPLLVAKALSIIHGAGLLIGEEAQNNFNIIMTTTNLYDVAKALGIVEGAGLLSDKVAQDNFYAITKHDSIVSFTSALIKLNNEGLLANGAAQANFNAVATNENPLSIGSALCTLNSVGLLTSEVAQKNRLAVTSQRNAYVVGYSLYLLRGAGLLTGGAGQANFDALLNPLNSLLHEDNRIWNIMPIGRPTATEFQALITIARNHRDNPENGRVALIDYINNNILNQYGVQPAFNTNQSTHTASVHASVSESATKLLTKYRSKIKGTGLDKHIKEFLSCVKDYETENKGNILYQAAARGISRIADANYEYVDKASGVSTRQLLALAWIAISDEEARIGTIGDAQTQLIEGLYEIQRGYNLSENNVDDYTADDKPICLGGTFNKLCEKLAGLHPDVDVLYITKKGATTKLPIVVVEEAKKYLNTLKQGAEELLELQNMINEENMEPLWKIISPNVAARLFDEFGSLYPQGKESQSFTEFFEQGIYALNKDAIALPSTSINPTSVAKSPHTLFGSDNNIDLDNSDDCANNRQHQF